MLKFLKKMNNSVDLLGLPSEVSSASFQARAGAEATKEKVKQPEGGATTA